MQLKQMFPPFIEMLLESQVTFIEKYRIKRMNDMAKPMVKKARKIAKPKNSKDAEKKAMLALLGIKLKDFREFVK